MSTNEGSNTMRRLTIIAVAVGVAAVAAVPANAHNAGCVQTGNGEYVFVGSNKNAPSVSENNPNTIYNPATGEYNLDLQPGPGDQYGARYAADQGNSAVERPSPAKCTPPESRA